MGRWSGKQVHRETGKQVLIDVSTCFLVYLCTFLSTPRPRLPHGLQSLAQFDPALIGGVTNFVKKTFVHGNGALYGIVHLIPGPVIRQSSNRPIPRP